MLDPNDPRDAVRLATEKLAQAADLADPMRQESLKRQAIEDMKRVGLEPIFFKGGPYDGRLYEGTVHFMASLPGERLGCWDEEVDRLGGSIVQLVRHVYQAKEENGKWSWVFLHTEEGPTKTTGSPKIRGM